MNKETSRVRGIRRTIALVTDAYGGRGGIALYNREFLNALSNYPGMEQIIVLPRSISYELEPIPAILKFNVDSAGSKLRYAFHTLRLMLAKRADLIVCGHLHLLPLAKALALRHRCPMVPLTYGVEAWTATPHPLANRLCGGLKAFFSIRHLTANRLRKWAGAKDAKLYYLPNCIHENEYGLAPKRQDLVERFALQGKRVVMTTGRMDSQSIDSQKGFDEVLDVLPELRRVVPEIVYLIVGDGNERARLEQKARDRGVADIVRFSGYVRNSEKADFYRLADVFAMPGSNPIFDRYPYRFVFLEALACGVPVVGCKVTDDSERNDADARALIIQVDPDDPNDILRGILQGLSRGSGSIHPRLSQFYYAAFQSRLHGYLDDLARTAASPRAYASHTHRKGSS